MVRDRLSTDASEELSDLLVHPRRRYVVRYCEDTADTTVGIEELAREIQSHEAGVGNETDSDDRRRLIEIDLHHAHLPKLSAGNVLEYDPQKTVVHWTEDAGDPYEELLRYRRVKRSREPRY